MCFCDRFGARARRGAQKEQQAHQHYTVCARLLLSFVPDLVRWQQISAEQTRAARACTVTAGHTQVNFCPPARVMFACDFEGCVYTAEQKKYLAVHKREHAGARTYACVEADCEALFVTPRALATHKHKHTGERPFACSTCTYTTTSKAYLLEHTRRHVGDMCHKCQVPGCAFMHPLRAGLVRHSRAVHNCMPEKANQWQQRSRLYIGRRE